MAKSKPTKLTQFFEGRRRKAFLNAWTHLKTRAGEPRIKLDLRLPLLNEPTVGMNEAIGEPFALMAKDNSSVGRTSLNVELEGMTLDLFTTSDPATSKKANLTRSGVKMVKLAIEAEGEGEKRTIQLALTAYLPAGPEVRDWAWDHLHSDFGMEAVYSQSEMEFEDLSEEETQSEEDPEEEEEELAAATPRKSGPRELTAYHAKHRVN